MKEKLIIQQKQEFITKLQKELEETITKFEKEYGLEIADLSVGTSEHRIDIRTCPEKAIPYKGDSEKTIQEEWEGVKRELGVIIEDFINVLCRKYKIDPWNVDYKGFDYPIGIAQNYDRLKDLEKIIYHRISFKNLYQLDMW